MAEQLSKTPAVLRLKFSIPDHLRESSDDAISRLRYLRPEILFELDGIDVICNGPEAEDWVAVRQEIYYALCRSKIRSEGASHRNALFAAVFER